MVYRSGHKQSCPVTDPTVVEKCSQSTHAVDPASDLYLPATHSEHGPPSGPVDPAIHGVHPVDPAIHAHVPPLGPEKPALQVQAVAAGLPKREFEFAGHVKHVDD